MRCRLTNFQAKVVRRCIHLADAMQKVVEEMVDKTNHTCGTINLWLLPVPCWSPRDDDIHCAIISVTKNARPSCATPSADSDQSFLSANIRFACAASCCCCYLSTLRRSRALRRDVDRLRPCAATLFACATTVGRFLFTRLSALRRDVDRLRRDT